MFYLIATYYVPSPSAYSTSSTTFVTHKVVRIATYKTVLNSTLLFHIFIDFCLSVFVALVDISSFVFLEQHFELPQPQGIMVWSRFLFKLGSSKFSQSECARKTCSPPSTPIKKTGSLKSGCAVANQ